MRFPRLAAALLALSTLSCYRSSTTTQPTGPGDVAMEMKTAVKPKDLSSQIKNGLRWLAKAQLKSGGWGQGDESQNMGEEMDGMRDTANVADTSMALLAYLRAGYSGRAGDYQQTISRGVDYVLDEVEKSDDNSMKVTDVTGTRVQGKIGQHADTFAALMMLSEAKGRMKDGVENARVEAAIKKIVKKIEKNQREDGSWGDQGWAPVLSQAMAAKGLNRAAQGGMVVSKEVLARVEKQAAQGLSADGRSFAAAGGAAGIEVYGAGASSGALRDAAVTKKARATEMKAKAAKAKQHKGPFQSPDVPTKQEIDFAEEEAQKADMAASRTEAVLVDRLQDSRFVGGFGNNGGEEFLSYMLISETLVQKGGDQWIKWDAAVSKLVNGVQNEDGSWTGHHCITGRTFCTAAALLVLMGDRTPAIQVIAT